LQQGFENLQQSQVKLVQDQSKPGNTADRQDGGNKKSLQEQVSVKLDQMSNKAAAYQVNPPVGTSQSEISKTLVFNHQCPDCPAKFKFVSELETHSRSVHSGTSVAATSGAGDDLEIFHQCDQCPCKFKYVSYLESHVKIVHSKSSKEPKEAPANNSTNIAESTVRAGDPKGQELLLQCVQCPLKCKSSSELSDHVRSCHPEEERNTSGPNEFTCPQCPIKFKFQHLLERHISVIHPKPKNNVESSSGTERTFPVKTFVNPIPSEDKPFQCPECPAIFQKKPLFDRHFERIHPDKVLAIYAKKNEFQPKQPNSTAKDFQCTVCKIKFQHKYLLVRHMTTVHEKPIEEVAALPAGSDPFNNSFAANSNPLADNSADKPRPKVFQCFECSQNFQYKYLLVKHLNAEHFIDVAGLFEIILKLRIEFKQFF
jgi:uncharacterized C2H2 Zn-finger protein